MTASRWPCVKTNIVYCNCFLFRDINCIQNVLFWQNVPLQKLYSTHKHTVTKIFRHKSSIPLPTTSANAVHIISYLLFISGNFCLPASLLHFFVVASLCFYKRRGYQYINTFCNAFTSFFSFVPRYITVIPHSSHFFITIITWSPKNIQYPETNKLYNVY